ncbi:MAG: hypothetical protein VXY77_03570 [Pseudomonadota bacterium]|nr:hypothetical protein [Pseudomonadota bacterium]
MPHCDAYCCRVKRRLNTLLYFPIPADGVAHSPCYLTLTILCLLSMIMLTIYPNMTDTTAISIESIMLLPA